MKKKTVAFTFGLLLAVSPVGAEELGFPTLNTVGRYFGVGWSHHTYHSCVDGRFNVITNRHPACKYPSTSLSSFYNAGYTNFPPRPYSEEPGFWRAPSVSHFPTDSKHDSSILPERKQPGADQPKTAPELDSNEQTAPRKSSKPEVPPKPKEPPPSWLKPYLDGEKTRSDRELIELEPSPNDGKHSTSSAPVNRYRR